MARRSRDVGSVTDVGDHDDFMTQIRRGIQQLLDGDDPAPPPLPYAKDDRNDPAWSNKAYELITNGEMKVSTVAHQGVRRLLVEGPCPRCPHTVGVDELWDAVVGEAMAPLGTDDDEVYVPIVVSCACGGDHPGRGDAVASGCGANFMLEVRCDA